jgi:hypothetical protein
VSPVNARANVRNVRRCVLLVVLGLCVQLACAFFWSPATFLLSALLGMPLVVVGAFMAWIYRSRSLVIRGEDT